MELKTNYNGDYQFGVDEYGDRYQPDTVDIKAVDTTNGIEIHFMRNGERFALAKPDGRKSVVSEDALFINLMDTTIETVGIEDVTRDVSMVNACNPDSPDNVEDFEYYKLSDDPDRSEFGGSFGYMPSSSFETMEACGEARALNFEFGEKQVRKHFETVRQKIEQSDE